MDAIHIRIGQNLQRVRKQRQLSIDKVANITVRYIKSSEGILSQE